jgi:hypothetical protein
MSTADEQIGVALRNGLSTDKFLSIDHILNGEHRLGFLLRLETTDAITVPLAYEVLGRHACVLPSTSREVSAQLVGGAMELLVNDACS